MSEFKLIKANSWNSKAEEFVWDSGQLFDSATSKFTDEINSTLSNDTKGIGKLINKYALSEIEDIGYGCCWLRLEFDENIKGRKDWKEIEQKIEEYLHELLFESDWSLHYMTINDLNQVGAIKYIEEFENAEEAIQCYIEAIYECGFTDDNEFLYETFEDIDDSKEIIDQHLVFRVLAGKYTNIKLEDRIAISDYV